MDFMIQCTAIWEGAIDLPPQEGIGSRRIRTFDVGDSLSREAAYRLIDDTDGRLSLYGT
jgi:hypothetical protein